MFVMSQYEQHHSV